MLPCRSVESTTMVSSFLLCMLSPVWKAKFCGSVGSGSRGRPGLELFDDDMSAFFKVLALGIGATAVVDGVPELVSLAQAADRYQVKPARNTRTLLL